MDDDVALLDVDMPEEEDEGSEEEAINQFLSDRRKEFERDKEADSDNRREAYDDMRFVADPVTQWDARDRQEREAEGRPCPSLSRLGPILKQVTNTIRRNKPEINLSPVERDDRADADVFEGIINHIERTSNASREYANWADDGVTCGIGHLRGALEVSSINPDWMDVILEHVEDPNSVVWDASAVKRDRTDARRGWVIDFIPNDEIEEAYEDAIGEWPDEEESTAWTDWHDDEAEETRVCEYYSVKRETVATYKEFATGEIIKLGEGDEAPEGYIPVSRTKEKVCRVWLLTGGKILEGGLEGQVVPGGRIPVFPYIASEKRVGRRKIRKGIVRDAKDSVRMINWAMALMIEAMAATPKPKWTGPAKAFEGHEEAWDNASSSNKAYLPYNDQAKAAPTYNQPPPFNVGLVNAMGVFDENIKQVTGIYDASLGARSNETSGKAIRAREEQGDTATFDYIDEFNYSIQAVGKWLVDVIPHIYTQERQIRILGANQKEKVVTINGYDEANNQSVNPVGRSHFDVVAKVGPGFATQREEAAETMRMAIGAAPDLAPILLDMMMEMEDWPGADKAAKRLAVMLPPEIKAAESGQQMPAPQPNPKDIASAEKDMAAAADLRMDTMIKRLEAVLAGIPPQLLAPQPSGGMGQSAPPNSGTPPGFP